MIKDFPQILLEFIVIVGVTTAIGVAVYYVTSRFYARSRNDNAMKQLEGATGNLLRVVGWIFALLLSLAFTNVMTESILVETAIESEAAVISEVHQDLRRFDLDETDEIRTLLVDYTQAVINEDWPALAQGTLSERASAVLGQLEDAVLNLEATGATQETLRSRLIADVDLISDHRLTRLIHAREPPPVILLILFFGYLLTMGLFGIYPPRRSMLVLLSFYTVFVGVVFYAILSTSLPFEGATPVGPSAFEYVLEIMRGKT